MGRSREDEGRTWRKKEDLDKWRQKGEKKGKGKKKIRVHEMTVSKGVEKQRQRGVELQTLSAVKTLVTEIIPIIRDNTYNL